MSSDPQLLGVLGGVLAQVLLQGWSCSCFPCAPGGSSHLGDAGVGAVSGAPQWVAASPSQPGNLSFVCAVSDGEEPRGSPPSSLHVTPLFQADGRCVLRNSVLGAPSL